MLSYMRCAVFAALALAAIPSLAADAELAGQVEQLVAQLDDRDGAERDAAEKALIELGLASQADGGEAFLALLPESSEEMAQETATRLERIRGEVQSRLARQMVVETRVTLDVTDAPLDDVLVTLQEQTGNRVVDQRDQYGQDAPEKRVTLKVDDVPFWSALDQILDQANMAPYPYAEEGVLALVERDQGVLRRFGRATYAGPFRLEPTQAAARRGLRNPDQSGLEVDLEISWEPRLRPVALVQSAADLAATSDDGLEVPATAEENVFNVEVPSGSFGAEVTIPLRLPAREAATLQSLRGKLTALTPGRVADLRFDDLANAADAVQEVGGVTVTLNRVVQNQALWEVHMRVRVESIDGGSEVQRGWVFQNVTFLEGAGGEILDHAGFETTLQNRSEVGFAYFFELPEGTEIGDYTWVYRTPAAIVELPVEYELNDIPLP
jgi:hypothetical protein